MRLLHAERLSRLTDNTTSVDKQDAEAVTYANAYGHEIVASAADNDVSGDVPPWDRPELGPYLKDPEKIALYDGILASHLDRLGRNARQLAAFREWCEDNNKAIITVEPRVDWSSDIGQLIWGIMAWLAEQELKAVKRRTRGTFAWLRDNGYLTGKCPFGFLIVEIEVGGKTRKIIQPHPIHAEYVRQMAIRYLAGQTLAELCEWMDAEGVKPVAWAAWNKKPAGKRGPEPVWQQNSISQLFSNPVLIGRLESKGDVVRDSKGQPMQRCEPILDDETWQRLQAKLDAAPKRNSTAPKDTALLTGILACAKCGGPMYRFTSTRKHPNGKTYVSAYYRCHGTPRKPSKCRNMAQMADIEAKVSEYIETHKSIEIMETVVVKGNTYGKQQAEVKAAMTALALTQDADDYDQRHAALRAEWLRLKDLKPEPDEIKKVSTGRTLAAEWPTMGTAERRQALLDGEFTVKAVKGNDGLRVDVTPGEAYKVMVAARRIPHPRG